MLKGARISFGGVASRRKYQDSETVDLFLHRGLATPLVNHWLTQETQWNKRWRKVRNIAEGWGAEGHSYCSLIRSTRKE